MTSRTQEVTLDTWFIDKPSDSNNYGNGTGVQMYVGETVLASGFGMDGWHNRFGIAIPRGTLFDGIYLATDISAFNIKLRTYGGAGGAGIGSAVKFYLERATVAFTEPAFGSASGDTYKGQAGSDSGRWPGPARTTTNRAEYVGSPGNGDWLTVNALALGREWFAHPEWTTLYLVAIGSNGSGGYGESTPAARCCFCTHENASKPFAEIAFTATLPPNAPSDLTPADGAQYGSTDGTRLKVSGRHTDPAGRPATQVQIQWFPTSATDETPGSPIQDHAYSLVPPVPSGSLLDETFVGLTPRTAGKWRMRLFTSWSPQVVSAWSPLRTATPAYLPSPVNIAVEPGTKTPEISVSIKSSDPDDYITAIQAFVYYDDPHLGVVNMWPSSGKHEIGGTSTRASVDYAGEHALEWGTPYRLQVIVWNRDDVPSLLSANVPFTQYEAVGAVIKFGADPVDTSVKIDTTTPTFNVSALSGVNIDEVRLWIDNSAGTNIYDTGPPVVFASAASKNVTIPAGVLSFSMDNPKVYAAVRVTGNLVIGPASEKFPIHLNAAPGTPYPVSVSGGQTVQRPDGVWVTTTDTPDVLFPFRDTDKDLGYDESPVRQEVEVRDSDLAPFAASPYIDSSSPSETFTSPALDIEETYDFRANYDDTANVRSGWSERVYVKYSAEPDLGTVTPADDATITDPTETVAWDYSHSGGVPMASYQLTASVDGGLIYDSGLVEGVFASADFAPFVLPDEETVDWELVVYNADGLSVTITRSFTTDFTQPDSIEGLTVTEDLDRMALFIEFDESDLPDEEFYDYEVWAKSPGEQFELVATILDKVSTSLYFRAAPHNTTVIIRVTQSNGWRSSEPSETSATLGGSGTDEIGGYWDVGADDAYELTHIQHGPGDTQAQIEQFTPPGRPDKILLDWGVTGYEGTFALLTKDRDQILRLRGYKDRGEVRLFKTPYGASRYVRYTSVPDTDRPGRWINGSVTYIEVAPTSTDF